MDLAPADLFQSAYDYGTGWAEYDSQVQPKTKQVWSIVLLLFAFAAVTRGQRSLWDILRKEEHKFIRGKSCHAVNLSNLIFLNLTLLGEIWAIEEVKWYLLFGLISA